MKLSHLFAFLGGAVAGAAVGLLFAPDSGANTREKIANMLKEKGIWLDKEKQLSEFVDKVMSKLKCNFSDDELREAVEEAASEK